MYFIQSASTISHQATFQNEGFFSSAKMLEPGADLVHPEYKKFIDARALRRMSKLLRMSLTCARDSLNQAKIDQPDAIIVGTGLGALADTEKFLNHFTTVKEGLIPPTSFIQSTHNTVAGQLSLLLKNHNYNMTHTQNCLSFENALQDALLGLDEGLQNILLGAADERIDFLDFIAEKLAVKPMQLTSGSSFFVLSKDRTENTLATIKGVQTEVFFNTFEDNVDRFLERNELDKKDIDLVLFSALKKPQAVDIQSFFKGCEMMDYSKYSGVYMTNPAFAMHWAANEINCGKFEKALICNLLHPKNLGLTLIENCET